MLVSKSSPSEGRANARTHSTLMGRVSSYLFDAVHRRNLVYNQCWEDPAVDRRR